MRHGSVATKLPSLQPCRHCSVVELFVAFFLENWFELVGVISGLLCVLLLIRENILTFPIGLVYAVVTTVVVVRANLYADALLNLYDASFTLKIVIDILRQTITLMNDNDRFWQDYGPAL